MKIANDFIKLHDAANNLPMGCLTSNIAAFESHDFEQNGKTVKKTLIYFVHPLTFGQEVYDTMYVNENVEKIMDLIYGE